MSAPATPLQAPRPAPAEQPEAQPLPGDDVAEREVLAHLTSGTTEAQEVFDRLTGEEFYLDADRAICRVVRSMLASHEALGLPSIVERIEADSFVDAAVKGAEPPGAGVYLSGLSGNYCSSSSLPARCERIAAKHVLRGLVRDAERIGRDARRPGADLTVLAQQIRVAVERLETGGGSDELVRVAMSGPEFMAADFPAPKSPLGDNLFCEGDGAILHAPAGMGKTFLGEQIAHAVASASCA
jgi:replicative DNA helicase